jgi:hypothetical protein
MYFGKTSERKWENFPKIIFLFRDLNLFIFLDTGEFMVYINDCIAIF